MADHYQKNSMLLQKQLNVLSFGESVKLNSVLWKKMQEYDHAVKILHERNTLLEERNSKLEFSLRQAGALLLNNNDLIATSKVVAAINYNTNNSSSKQKHQQHYDFSYNILVFE